MRSVRFETFKYPSQPRYFFPALVVRESEKEQLFYIGPGLPIYVGKSDSTFIGTKNHLTLMWPDVYYNISLFWDGDWNFECYYVNLALPHQWDGELCTYIDLELDVMMTEDGTITILDEDEYEEGKIRYNYPQELIAQIERSTKEVVALMEARTYPFDNSLLNWRPGNSSGENMRLAV